MGIIKKIATKFGLDKAILFTSSSSILGAFGSVVSVILVVKYLTGVEQGFYYTFGSIVAIQIFFELGLNGIITQYAAHEMAHLQWQSEHELSGESKYISRLSSLLHFSFKWYLFFASILIVSLIAIGYIYFNRYSTGSSDVSWGAPWILLAAGTGINLIISPAIAFLQGLGKVKEIAKAQLILQIFKLVIMWGGLIAGAKLYVLGLVSFMGVLIYTLVITLKYRKLLANIWQTEIIERVHYRKEIFPYQWKIAMSWISGYFIFQLFNPVLFATEGAVVAGQMGMTLAAIGGISSITIAWISTKVPTFSGLIAQKKYDELDTLFNNTLLQSFILNIILLLGMFAVIFGIRYFNISMGGKFLGDRFLPYLPMSLMMLSIVANNIITSWATYLRCHKKEPMMVLSIAMGIACTLSTVLLGKYFGVLGMTTGYMLLCVMSFICTYFIFITNKRKWHQ
jgi:O-antigen/teichoic acid export membrane protein